MGRNKTHVDFREMESCVSVTAANIDVNPNTLFFYFGKMLPPKDIFGFSQSTIVPLILAWVSVELLGKNNQHKHIWIIL